MRHISQKMINFLDAKLSPNGLAQHAIDTKDSRLLFGLAAETCVGIREAGGNNRGPLVEEIQRTIGRAQGEPWCMGFVQTCLAYAELKTGTTSPITPSEHCRTVWANTPRSQRVKVAPMKYAIAIWGLDDSASGHTGIVVEANRKTYFMSVEGNTNGDGSRDGDGIYYKKRDWIRNGSLMILGFLKPF